MASLWHNFTFAVRSYSRQKTFTLMAVLTLALGIGASTGLFTVINAVLLRPLPYPQPERIVQVYDRRTSGTSPVLGYPWFRFAERSNRSFEYLAAYGKGPRVNVTSGDLVQVVQSIRVSSNAFRVFGVHPVMGRDFTREDDQPGAAPVAIISHPLWTGLYGSDSRVLDRAIQINGESYSIVGVMKPGFTGGPDTDVWIPLRKSEDWTEQFVAYLVIGRLRDSVTMEGARQDLDLLWARLKKERPDYADDHTLGGEVTTYLERIVGGYRMPLLLLGGASACILLIVCVNVANLFLARAVGRRKEIAVRIALGVSRARLLGLLLTESLLLATIGGMIGVIMAAAFLRALKPWLTDQLIRGHEVSMDWRILWFTLLVTAFTGIAFGLVPALQLARVSALLALRDFGTTTGSRSTRRFRAGLISAQIGLSVALLLAAGLLVTSFEKLRTDDLGFTPRGVLTIATSMAGARLQGTAQVTANVQQLIDRLTAIPGVKSVAVTSALPTTYAGVIDVALPPGTIRDSQFPSVGAEPRQIAPGYFDVMRIKIVSGRAFVESDTARSTQVAIINEAFVRKHFGGINPVGSHILIGQGSGKDYADQPREIVGVAADTRGERRMEDAALPCIYVPMAQLPDRTMAYRSSTWSWTWVIRTEGDPQALNHQVREEMRKAAPSWVIENPKPMSAIMSEGIEKQKFQAVLLAAFAGIALLLAAIGLYGTMSQTLAERRHELGVRSALGATSRDLVLLLMRYSLKLVAVGLIVGLTAAAGFHRLIAVYLFGIKPFDLAVYAVVLALLISTALMAALVPALRARKVNPRILLQQ